jgi:hypothetical protein
VAVDTGLRHLVRIATRNLGATDDTLHIREHDADEVYHIDDLHPWVHFGVNHAKRPELGETQPGYLERSVLVSDGLTWHRWCPLSKKETTLSAERRFGYYEVQFGGAWSGRLRCYVWPARLFNRQQMTSMIRAIVSEVGRPISWERSDSPVRAYATRTTGGRVEVATLLKQTVDELHAVELLQKRRRPREESLQADEGDVGDRDSPEERLIALWALRRLRQIVDYRHSLERAISLHKDALWEYAGNRQRIEEHEGALARALPTLQAVARTAARVRAIAQGYAQQRGPLALAPSMQRDYRLRRLLRAFNAPTHEWLAEQVSELSTLPPIKAPELFELWGAVHIAKMLRALGWQGGQPTIRGTSQDWGVSALDGCTWRFMKEDEELIFDFSPRPRVIDLVAIPATHARATSTWQWAAEQLGASANVLYALAPSTPDYALRWSRGSRYALCIGDASLADPRHQKGNKVAKVCEYRREVAWRVEGGKVVTCSLGGTFVLFPGPSSHWDAAVHEAARQDCYALCPEPGVQDDADTLQKMAHMLAAMRERAS